MPIQIQIISAKPVTANNSKGKPYTYIDLVYKNLSFQGKVEGRKIMSFGATEPAFKSFGTAQPDEFYDVEVVKNEQSGFNDWVSAKKSSSGVSATHTTSGVAYASTTSSSPKSTYETPEERAKKQVYIVRQSSISSAIALHVAGSKTSLKLADVLDTAALFEHFVFGTSVVDDGYAKEKFAGLEDPEFADIPL